jgi:hypothetical protein
MPRIYSGANYSMGDAALESRAANAPITSAQAQASKRELARMRASLASWLKYRGMNDTIAAGQGASIQTPIFKKPGASLPTPEVMALRLRRQRADDESELALHLHQLLSEVFDSSSLPDPNVQQNPNAAVDLARIAIAGKLPTEAASAASVGSVWMWPLVVVIGVVAFVVMTAIRSSADVAKHKEELACIEAGKCTDTGFWIKLGAATFVGWIVWDKLGVGVRVKRALGAGRSRRSAR